MLSTVYYGPKFQYIQLVDGQHNVNTSCDLSMTVKAKWAYWSHLLVRCTKAKIVSLIHVLKTVQ